NKRQAVEVVADAVQFLGGRDDMGGGGQSAGFQPRSDVPVDTSDFAPAGAPAGGRPPVADADLPLYAAARARPPPRPPPPPACRRHQNQIARAVKRARELALLPYVSESTGDERTGGRRDRGDRDRDR